MIFVEKNFGDLTKNCPLNMISLLPPPEFFKFSELAPLARGTLVNPDIKHYLHYNQEREKNK
jgi:hypothetical protein